MISLSRIASLVVPNKMPLVAVACICEKVLREEDGVLTAVRIVDRFQLQVPGGLPEGAVPGIPLTALISIKSGDVQGRSEISLRLRTPTGGTVEGPERYPILLRGREHGTNLIVNLLLPATVSGSYELDVLWNGEWLTTIPFRLVPENEPLRSAT